MRRSRWTAAVCRVGLVACLAIALGRDAAAQTIDTIDIRGHAQSLHLYGTRGAPPVIVSSGDGGWVHLGPHVADVLAARGYFVVGFDTKGYLESFTSGKSTLRPEDEPSDYKVLADYAARGSTERPILVGVSEGAGLSVLAATDPRTKKAIAGVVALGLPNLNELGWRWKDSVIYLTHSVPNEPTFSTAAVVERVSPAPIAAIHSRVSSRPSAARCDADAPRWPSTIITRFGSKTFHPLRNISGRPLDLPVCAASTVFDVGVMLIAGLVAYVLEENGFPSAPAILGVVLGGMLEENFISSMIKSDGNLLGFFSRPIAASLGVLTLSAWFLPPVIRRLRRLAGA